MRTKDRVVLVASMALSLLVWKLFYDSWVLSACLIVAIMIHEYGHYWWMGKEGIGIRKMVMLPPFGAVAQAGQMWPSLLAEARIALAGPIFGLLASGLFVLCYVITGSVYWLGGVYLSAFINLFNLVIPISLLDGGRVLRSSARSIHQYADYAVLAISVWLILYMILFWSPFLGLLIAYFFYHEVSAPIKARAWLGRAAQYKQELSVKLSRREYLGADEIDEIESTVAIIDRGIIVRQALVTPLPKMNYAQIAIVFGVYFSVIAAHMITARWAYRFLGMESIWDFSHLMSLFPF